MSVNCYGLQPLQGNFQGVSQGLPLATFLPELPLHGSAALRRPLPFRKNLSENERNTVLTTVRKKSRKLLPQRLPLGQLLLTLPCTTCPQGLRKLRPSGHQVHSRSRIKERNERS